MAEEKTESSDNDSGFDDLTKKIRTNPWIVSTIVIGLFAVVLLFFMFKGGLTGNVISENDIGTKAVDFINNQLMGGQGNVTLASVTTQGNLYEVLVNYDGQQIPAYFTKDGAYFLGTQIIPTATNSSSTSTPTATPKEVPKSDKPVVDAYVFSYCPYGLQFEKALLPVYDLLKSKADINIVYIGAMHGEFEHVESLRQISILKLYGNDKLFAYLKEFNDNADIGSCSGDAACLNKYLPAIYSKLGINQAQVEAYMNSSAEAIYAQNEAQASSLGVSGSPTFMINGVESQVSRTPVAIEQAICSAFNTAPSECSQVLSSASPDPGFGSSTATGASASAASCG
jgi:hypothetical protein